MRTEIRRAFYNTLNVASFLEIADISLGKRDPDLAYPKPLVVIYGDDESVERLAKDPIEFERNYALNLEISKIGDDFEAIQQDLDNVANAIENLVFNYSNFKKLRTDFINDINLSNVGISFSESGAKNIFGTLELSFEVKYCTKHEVIVESNLTKLQVLLNNNGNPQISEVNF